MQIENLVETHCHILPNIDDGAKDINTSLKMIEKLSLSGAKNIILTPHYYSDSISLDDFIEKRDTAFNELKKALPYGSPNLYCAGEVFISQYLFSNANLDKLKIANTDYVLIEHPFNSEFSQRTYERLINMMCDYKIKPILAHIERYKPLINDDETLDAFKEIGCLVQVNINSFVNAPRNVRKKLFKYLDEGKIDLFGSDCHNLDTRSPSWDEGAKEIIKKCGRSAFNNVVDNANKLFFSK